MLGLDVKLINLTFIQAVVWSLNGFRCFEKQG